MKIFSKIFACAAIAASMLLFACNINEDDGVSSSSFAQSSSSFENKDTLLVMDSRVVSYKMIHNCVACGYEGGGFITDQDTLKSWFPHIFKDEQAEPECNYFAVYSRHTSSTLIKYWILSKDMRLYQIEPGYAMCPANADIAYHVMLVCDDTEEGNLKDKIDINNIQLYTDENWDCREEGKWEDVFF